jgi:hypothetical protein
MSDTLAQEIYQYHVANPRNKIMNVYSGEEAMEKIVSIHTFAQAYSLAYKEYPTIFSQYTQQERADSIFFTYCNQMRRYPRCYWVFVIGDPDTNNARVHSDDVGHRYWDSFCAEHKI